MSKPDQKMYQSWEEYQTHFRAKEYLKFYTSDSMPFFIETLHGRWLDTYASGALQGKRFLDFGCGPCINMAIPASRSFDELYLCDYVAENRQAVQDWIDQKPSAHDWTPFLELTAEREGGGVTCDDVASRTRQKIKQVFPCDAYNIDNPFHPNQFEPGYFDCIVSNLCLHNSCSSVAGFNAIVKKLGTYLKPGAHMAIGVAVDSSFYMVGDSKFFDVPVQAEHVENALREAGFVNVQSEMIGAIAVEPASDSTGPLLVRGMKK